MWRMFSAYISTATAGPTAISSNIPKGLVITDEEIIVKVLESIDEYYNEGKTQGICVFGSGYYKKADTLILSARIGDEIIETVEVDLRTLEVVQCHGKHNQDTEYHERIIDLVNKNANLIRWKSRSCLPPEGKVLLTPCNHLSLPPLKS